MIITVKRGDDHITYQNEESVGLKYNRSDIEALITTMTNNLIKL